MTGIPPRLWQTAAFCAVFSAAAFPLALPAHAQDPNAQIVDRAQLLRTQTLRDDPTQDATGTDENHAVASPNDPDLGEQAILKRSENYRAFTVSVAAPFSYTSNVALTSRGTQSDVLFTPGVGITYAPRLTKTLFASLSVGQQFFYYDRFSELDFGSFDARAGLTYALPQFHNLLLRADYGYNRLTNNDYEGFFANHTLAFGAELPFRIGRAQQISVGADTVFSLHADPAEPARHDFSGFVGYSANLTRDLSVNAVGRLAVRDYVEGDRTDVSGIFALSATYRFTKWFSANAATTFATNDSNRDVFDYDVVNVGGALALVYRF